MITFGDFVGAWKLHREIEDKTGQSSGTFEGEAVFAAVDASTLNYREAGLLRLTTGQQMRAERGYVWQKGDAHVQVLFADGRPFHGFALSDAAEADHWCDPDMYRVTYDFAHWPKWQSQWRVTGPRKDYVMRSSFSR